MVYGMDTLDEITITGRTRVTELKNGRVRTYYVTPAQFGLHRSSLDDIKGGNAKENADIVVAVLKGERSPRRDVVLIMHCRAGSRLGQETLNGRKMAAQAIDSDGAR